MSSIDSSFLDNIPGIRNDIKIILKSRGIKELNDLFQPENFELLSKEAKYFITLKPETKIEYNTIDNINNLFKSIGLRGIIAGSYRRKSKFMKDIDFVSYDNYSKILRKLNSLGITIIDHSRGDEKVGAIIDFTNFTNNDNNLKNRKFRIDIWFPRREERIYYILQCTGSAKFNIIMRTKLKKINPCKNKNHKDCRYTLSQHGLFIIHNRLDGSIIKKMVLVKSEKEIFELANMKYIPPEDRSFH